MVGDDLPKILESV